MKDYVDYVYDIIRLDCSDMDSIDKHLIIYMVGVYGFNVLVEHKLIEGFKSNNGHTLYKVCDKER